MKRLQISDRELIAVLRRMAPETLSLTCLGCGYERSCSIHGCAVLRMAADRLKELAASPPNPPLTLEELREMVREPYWHVCLKDDSQPPHWAILHPHIVKYLDEDCGYGKTWLAYRREPEEGM